MPKSRTNNKRKQKLNQFKQKNKQMSEQQQTQSIPPVRNVPTWQPDTNISVKGFEFEVVQNFIVNLQLAQQAVQSIMSRNIVDGNIVMDFEKINPLTLKYEPMTDEEKVPYRADFDKMLDGFRKAEAEKQAAAAQAPVVQAGPPTTEAKPKGKAKVVKLPVK